MDLVEQMAIALFKADGGKEHRWGELDEGQAWNTNTRSFWRAQARAAFQALPNLNFSAAERYASGEYSRDNLDALMHDAISELSI